MQRPSTRLNVRSYVTALYPCEQNICQVPTTHGRERKKTLPCAELALRSGPRGRRQTGGEKRHDGGSSSHGQEKRRGGGGGA